MAPASSTGQVPVNSFPAALASLDPVRLQCLLALVFIGCGVVFSVSRFLTRTTLLFVYRLGLFAGLAQQLVALKSSVPGPLGLPMLMKAVKAPGFPSTLVFFYLWMSRGTFVFEVVALLIFAAFTVIDLVPRDELLSRHPWWRQYGAGVSAFLQSRRQLMLLRAAHLELFSFVLTVGSVLTFRGTSGISDVFFFTQYLVMQHIKSPTMRAAIGTWDRLLALGLAHSQCPPLVKQAEASIRAYLTQMRQQLTNVFGSTPDEAARRQ
jgi:hypothetical protein